MYVAVLPLMVVASLLLDWTAPHSSSSRIVLFSLTLAGAAYTALDFWVRTRHAWQGLRYTTPLVTVGLISIMVNAVGGHAPVAFVLYFPAVVLSSILSGRTIGLLSAVFAALGYAVAIGRAATPMALLDFVLVSSGLLVVGALSGGLVDQERRLRRRAQEGHAREQASLLRLGDTLSKAPDIPTALHAAVEVALQALQADAAAVVTKDGERFVLSAALGTLAPFVGREVSKASESIAIAAIEGAHAVVAQDLGGRSSPEGWSPDWEGGLRSGAAVPVMEPGPPCRALVVYTAARRDFPEDEVHLLSLLAGQTGAAVEGIRDEQALRASEGELRALLAAMTDAILVMDSDGRYLKVAPTNPGLLFRPANEVTGRTLHEIFSPAQADAFLGYIRQALESGQTVNVEYRLPIGSADTWFAASISPMPNGTVVWVARDIGQRKRAEEALAVSEKRFRILIENSLEALALVGADGRVAYVTPAHTRILGHPQDEVVGRDYFGWVHPEDLPNARRQFQDLLHGPGDNASGHFRFRHSNGSWRWIDWAANNLVSEPSVGAVVVHYRDVTERIQREREREAIVTVATALRAAPTRAEMLPVVLRELMNLLNVEAAAMAMRDPASGDIVFELGRGRWTNATGTRLSPGEGVTGLVMATGQSYSTANVYEDKRNVQAHLHGDLDAAACVPLVAQGQTIGVLWVGRKAELASDEMRLVSVVADIAASAMHRATLYEQTQRMVSEFAALYQTARDLGLQKDVSTLLEIIVKRAVALLAAPGGVVYLYDASTQELELTVAKAFSAPAGIRLGLGEGLAGRVAQGRQPVIVDDYRTWPQRSPKFAGHPLAAAVLVPMLYGGELIGVLGVFELGDSVRKFADADERLLSLFAGQAAGAVHGARLLEETSRRLAELEAVNRLSTTLRATQSLGEMLPRLLDETLAVLETDAGILWLHNSASGEMRAAVARGWFAGVEEAPMLPTEGIAGHVFTTGQAHVTREFATDPRTRESSRSQVPPGWGGACVPIRSTDRTVGVLFVSVALPRELTSDEIRMLDTLAEMAGNGIHRTRLNEETEQRLQHLGALRTIDMAITASLDIRVTLNVILDQVVTQLSVDAAAVMLLDQRTQTLKFSAGRGFHGNTVSQASVRLGEGHTGRAAIDRRPAHVADLRVNGGRDDRSRLLASEGFIGYHGVPLIAKGQTKGVLEIFHRSRLERNPEWVGFLETLAGQAAIAVDNASLFDELQRSNAELALAYDTTLEGWSRALDLRDHETEGHTQRVTEMTLRLGRLMGLKDEELVHVRRGALLHDIGKMGIPDNILLKPGPLDDTEWHVMRRHAEYAYEMLSPITFLRPALDIPYSHHEKWDGTGYPRGLQGESIPLTARIFALADVWDALRSDRPYRPAWPEPQVESHIRDLTGTHFDPAVVEAFWRLHGEIKM